ncbi:hypothetical protein IEQ34_002993 [Dendrobium chrysotoxum]|uniref:Uncharacterized protein n=1 Tax=Dendrobium chrysotoxum TaxID=161865 RepID=A0AAV7HKW7_DENCH|nr:hypothetical protein IEQ34_002993 [Dendrobium chrysotoxum]
MDNPTLASTQIHCYSPAHFPQLQNGISPSPRFPCPARSKEKLDWVIAVCEFEALFVLAVVIIARLASLTGKRCCSVSPHLFHLALVSARQFRAWSPSLSLSLSRKREIDRKQRGSSLRSNLPPIFSSTFFLARVRVSDVSS